MKPYKVFKAIGINHSVSKLQKSFIYHLTYSKQIIYNLIVKFSKIQKKDVNILVVSNLGGIGNCIASTPLVQSLRIVFPNAFIVFLTVKGDLFHNWCVADLVIKDKEDIPNIEFDYLFVPYWGYPNPPKWVKEINAKKIIKPKIWLDSWFLKPERSYNVDMARKLGYKGLEPPEYVNIKKPNFSLPEKRISILPCSNSDPKWQNKRWSQYGELVKLLLGSFEDYYIVVLGTKTDDVSGINFSEKVLDFRDSLTLSETAFALKGSLFAVGNDCGPAHIADCVGTKTFVIFGPTCPVKNKFQNKTTQILPNLKCSPCQYTKQDFSCTANCKTFISSEYVLDVILKKLRYKTYTEAFYKTLI